MCRIRRDSRKVRSGNRRRVDGSGRHLCDVRWTTLSGDADIRPRYFRPEFWDRILDICRGTSMRRTCSVRARRPGLAARPGDCGVCGARMAVRYHSRGNRLASDYVCTGNSSNRGTPPCQLVPGGNLDQAIGKVLVEMITPVKLEQALAVQQEIDEWAAEAGRLYQMQVERPLRIHFGRAPLQGGGPGQPPRRRNAGSRVERQATPGAGSRRT